MLVSGLNLSTLRSLVITISRSYHVSSENGWKSVLLRNLNRFNRNRLRLKRLIPIEHDLRNEDGYGNDNAKAVIPLAKGGKRDRAARAARIFFTFITRTRQNNNVK